MIKRVLIIGGYGNFGSFIAKTLARETNIQIIVAGRSIDKAKDLIAKISAVNLPKAISLDINSNIEKVLSAINPHIVIHTSGPFQAQAYDVAKACIALGSHYIDIADGRDFVEGIVDLDAEAKEKGVLVVSGASSVPCLTSALLDHYQDEFCQFETLSYGITTAQKTTRGLATTEAILGYTGKPFKTLINGKFSNIYGWQNLHSRKFKKLGRRFLGNCDIPDLALFPQRYKGLKTIRFYAGLEIPFVHITLWVLSWLVRIGLIKNLQSASYFLLRISFLFDWLGTANSAFYMELLGKDKFGKGKGVSFEMTARSGDGPYIPCMPAILLAKKLASCEENGSGAFPCVDFISLSEYLDTLCELDISWEKCVL